MKILFPIGTLYPSQLGGPSNTVYWMAKSLHANKLEVTCISTSLGINDNSLKFDTCLETNYGKGMYTNDKIHTLPFKFLLHAFKEVRTNDIIHLTSLFYLPTIMISLIAILFNKKIVWSVRGTLEDSAIRISALKKKFALLFIKMCKHKILFHSTSPAETMNLRVYMGKDCSSIEIPNYIELPEKMDRIDHARKAFLYIGRLHPIKAIDHLILALAESKIFAKDETASLNIAGQGSELYTEYLQSLVAEKNLNDKVKFLGQVEGLDKQLLLANSHFTILPSHSENFGNVVLESLAQGTPVVSSTGTPWEILIKSKAGFWVENDIDSLSKVINEILIMDEAKYNNYRENSLALSRKYNIDLGVHKWIKAYKSLI